MWKFILAIALFSSCKSEEVRPFDPPRLIVGHVDTYILNRFLIESPKKIESKEVYLVDKEEMNAFLIGIFSHLRKLEGTPEWVKPPSGLYKEKK